MLNGACLETLVGQLDDAVAFVDPSGTILLTNRAAGFPARGPPARMTDLGDAFKIFQPDGQPYAVAEWPVLRSVGTGEVVTNEEFFRVLPDGSRRSFSCNCAPIYDEAGRIVAAVIVSRDVTEQKRSWEQLAYLLPMLDYTEDAIIANDPEWRITAWNKGAERMYGWTAEEALGRPGSLLRLYESAEQRLDRRRELARLGRWRGEIIIERKDGSKLPVEAIAAAIRDARGKVTGYLGIHRDITERERAEESLQESNRRIAGILESISDIFFAVDREWRYTYVNERAVAQARKAWGREAAAEELLGRNCWELFPETVGTPFDEELHRAVRGQQVVEFETSSLVTGASIEVRAYPSKDGLSVYSRDTTERNRAREQLAYHASLLENVEDGVIATHADDFCITAWNKGAERLYGFTAEEAVGHPAREVASYPGDSSRLELEQELVETGRTRIEFTAHRKDGTPIEVELIAVAVRDAEESVTGYLGIHRDITERKRAEQALREAQRRSETILESITDDFVAVDHDWRYTYLNDRALRSTQEWLGWPISREELLGRSLWEVFPETVGTVPYVKYHQAVRDGRPVDFETYFAVHDSWFETHVYPSESGLSIYFRTITERKRAEEQLERRVRQQAAVAELGLRALEDGHLQPLMNEAVTLVCRTLGVEYAKIDELLPGGEQLLVRAGAGWREGVVGSARMPTGLGSPAGYALLTDGPLIVDDMAGETRFEVPALLHHHEVMSDITVVIDPQGNTFGTLVAASTNQRTFSEDDVSFLQAVANVLASAIDRAETSKRMESARETERARIARDLHDAALSELTDALALATVGRTAATDQREELRWEAVIGGLQGVAQQVREAIYDLRLADDEDRVLADRLVDLVSAQSGHGNGPEISLRAETRLPAGSLGQRGTEVLRIVGQAIVNARRHSGARTVRVDAADSSGDVLRLEITDDGDWPDRESDVSNRRGSGIRGMFDRADQLGAQLRIEGRTGGGTRVSLEIPLTEPDGG